MRHRHELTGLKNTLHMLPLDNSKLWSSALLWLTTECKSELKKKLMPLEVIQ